MNQADQWVIVDTETTGVFLPVYAVEIAAQRMRGWLPEGPAFEVLLNHDVPIEPGAQAVHGYSREYLRWHGHEPRVAHAAFRAYAGELPLVAHNLSFDWDRVLWPEYHRLGIPPVGRKGFCALTLARRVIQETPNYRLETLKRHFRLSDKPSHRGAQDVEALALMFARVYRERLGQAGIVGFDKVAAFSRKTPVNKCRERIFGAMGAAGVPSGASYASATALPIPRAWASRVQSRRD